MKKLITLLMLFMFAVTFSASTRASTPDLRESLKKEAIQKVDKQTILSAEFNNVFKSDPLKLPDIKAELNYIIVKNAARAKKSNDQNKVDISPGLNYRCNYL